MNPQRDDSPNPLETLAFGALIALGVASAGHWLAASLAALVGRQRSLDAGLVESFSALRQLPKDWSDPRRAWAEPASSNLPGPVLYWLSVAVVLAVALCALVLWLKYRQRRHEPIDRRRRVGVDTQPRLATTKDLEPLLGRAVESGRLVLGRWGRRVLMTEGELFRGRRGVRGAVLLFGPSQSGKTTRLIESVSAWTGPAVISSVKTDLMRATLERRRAIGEVRVFDPIGISGMPCATWSPLRVAKSLSGALAAAQLLARAGGDDGPSDRFWRGQAEQLIAAMLWVAANTKGHSMRNVVRWVVEMDRPDGENTGTLSPLVRLLTDNEDESIALAAKQVRGWLHGQWSTDPRTTSSVYATARNAVWPWTDPGLAESAEACEITLDWLCAGSNTLYLCAPLGDESRVGVVFAALLHDLVAQAFDRNNRQGSPIDPRLLVVLDEAANTPLPKLPQWAATITGAGIQLVTVWQSKAQLDQAYGKDADNVLTNHRTKLIFPSGLSDLSTIGYISALVGDEHVRSDLDERTGASGDVRPPHRGPSTAVPFLSPSTLRRVRVGDALLVHGALPPAWMRAARK
jgi:type IV secretion system protein VirD4